MSSIVIAGDTSGSVTLQAPAVAGATVITLPSTSTTLVSSQWTTTGLNISYTTGNVGIGTTSSSAPLNVQGEATGGLAVRLNGRSSDNYSELAFWNNANSTNYGILGADQAAMYFGTNTSLPVTFTTNSAERARIDSSGNLGIGTSSPAQKLHVLSASATATVAKFAATNYGNLGTTYIEIGTQNSDGGSRIGSINPSGNLSTLVFETMTASSGVYAERARITSAGDFLFGTTTSPSSSGVGSGFVVDSDGRALLIMRTNTTSGRSMCDFGNPNGSVGSISVTGSATAYNTSSDYRLKNTIAPMTGALDKVAQLKPCTYKWNADGSDGEGFIAHELAEVCPNAVSGEKDAVDADGNPKYQGIDVSFLVATLTAAIQELKAEFDAYKASHP